MDSSYKELLDLAQVRRARLEESLALQKFYRDVDEEEIWISEKDTFLSSTDYGRDLNTTMLLLKKHEVLHICKRFQISFSVVQVLVAFTRILLSWYNFTLVTF